MTVDEARERLEHSRNRNRNAAPKGDPAEAGAAAGTGARFVASGLRTFPELNLGKAHLYTLARAR
jgi:hypothetical protein